MVFMASIASMLTNVTKIYVKMGEHVVLCKMGVLNVCVILDLAVSFVKRRILVCPIHANTMERVKGQVTPPSRVLVSLRSMAPRVNTQTDAS
jgi:hypothetical protein